MSNTNKVSDTLNMALSQKVGDALKLKSGYWEDGRYVRTLNHPDFAKDMNNAEILVEAMTKKNVSFNRHNGKAGDKVWSVVWFYDGKTEHEVTHTHAPTAILKAAAKALGVYDE